MSGDTITKEEAFPPRVFRLYSHIEFQIEAEDEASAVIRWSDTVRDLENQLRSAMVFQRISETETVSRPIASDRTGIITKLVEVCKEVKP